MLVDGVDVQRRVAYEFNGLFLPRLSHVLSSPTIHDDESTSGRSYISRVLRGNRGQEEEIGSGRMVGGQQVGV